MVPILKKGKYRAKTATTVPLDLSRICTISWGASSIIFRYSPWKHILKQEQASLSHLRSTGDQVTYAEQHAEDGFHGKQHI
ncbi:hypothetical protein PoB_007209300 [Plakobranchus ocellatus]|uniref:Uncharacterized protein n=1 Tax=Plakobranchus ocellatus TaxID=259542 RepID=A0AAV4DMN8_9GAST|nr:hypothetical protein PoB_007209300 [Plakobranchus ocellatus]